MDTVIDDSYVYYSDNTCICVKNGVMSHYKLVNKFTKDIPLYLWEKVLHREDGPAVERFEKGYKSREFKIFEYYIDGNKKRKERYLLDGTLKSLVMYNDYGNGIYTIYYDESGEILTEEEYDNYSTTYFKYENGRRIREKKVIDGVFHNYEQHEKFGNRVVSIIGRGYGHNAIVKFKYDEELGYLKKKIDNRNSKVSILYDKEGKEKIKIKENKGYCRYGYDINIIRYKKDCVHETTIYSNKLDKTVYTYNNGEKIEIKYGDRYRYIYKDSKKYYFSNGILGSIYEEEDKEILFFNSKFYLKIDNKRKTTEHFIMEDYDPDKFKFGLDIVNLDLSKDKKVSKFVWKWKKLFN